MAAVTFAIGRAEHRSLLRSSLLALAGAALALLALACFMTVRWQFRAADWPKSGLLFLLGALQMLRALPAHHPFDTLGQANGVTLGRGVLVCLLAGLIGERAPAVAAVATALALLVLAMDGVDGRLARRDGTVSDFGARFDMETDAVFVAVLAVLTWQLGKAGPWILLSGAMRYLFMALALAVPLLRRPVPSSRRGKTIAVIQMLALILAIAPFCPAAVATVLAAVALALLTASFLLDVRWQWQDGRRTVRAQP